MRGILLVVTLLASVATASAWSLRSPDDTGAIAIGPDAIIEIMVRRAPRDGAYDVVRKRSSKSGRVLWQRKWRGLGPVLNDNVSQVAFAPNGDVLAAGSMTEGPQYTGFVVRRLDARTGRTLWHAAIHGTASDTVYENAFAIAIAPDGDVVAGGSINERNSSQYGGTFAVVALDGATGTERWRYVAGGASGSVRHLAIDPAGNVIAGGTVAPDRPAPYGTTILALTGDGGALRWSTDTFPELFDVSDLTIDARGDVYLGGSGDGFAVAKIAGATGAIAWITRLPHISDRLDGAERVLVDGDAIFAAGTTNDGTGPSWTYEGSVFQVVRLDPATGEVRWSHRTGGGGNTGIARELAVAADGSILAAGSASTPTTCADAFVAALDRTTGELRWSERFDGALSTDQCHPDCEGDDDCPAVDRDSTRALGVDGAGRIVVAGVLVGGTKRHATYTSFLRLLAH